MAGIDEDVTVILVVLVASRDHDGIRTLVPAAGNVCLQRPMDAGGGECTPVAERRADRNASNGAEDALCHGWLSLSIPPPFLPHTSRWRLERSIGPQYGPAQQSRDTASWAVRAVLEAD